jgi:hypothetical protein
MAIRYVSNNPVGANANTSPYDTLAKAATTFTTAITGAAAGDVFAFSNLHSEAIASATTYTLPGTGASPNQMYSFDNTQTTISATNLLAGAILSTTLGNALSFVGICSECIGFTFTAGSGANSAILTIASTAGSAWRLYNCALQHGATNGAAGAITLGAGSSNLIELHNTTVQFGATGDQLAIKGVVRWVNTPNAVQGATIPTTLFNLSNSLQDILFCEGVDFSAMTGKSIINNNVQNQVILKDCKLPASVTLAATPTVYGSWICATRCDSAGTNYLFNSFGYSGTESTESTITRVGGASTPDGTLFSAKIVTNANALWGFPFEALPLSEWNTLTGSSHTITIYGTINSGTLPNNDEIWIEVEYLKDAGDPMGGYVISTKANNLASGVPVASDGSTWNGGGSGGGWSPFKMTASFTPQLTGPVTVRIFAGKATTTYYIDPHVYLV